MERDNLCPECNGSGNGERWSYTYNEWEWYECRACHGYGTIATHPTEQETARSAYALAGGTLHAERRDGRDTMTLVWPIARR